MKNLTDAFCRKVKPPPPKSHPIKFFDGRGTGMFFQVTSAGRKTFRLKYRLDGRENSTSLGVYPACGLKDAREKATEARKLIDSGINPSQERDRIKQERIRDSRDTFEKVKEDWLDLKKREWKGEEAAKKYSRVLRRLDCIGKIPIQQVTQKKLLEVLLGIIEEGHYDLAKKVNQNANNIFLFAMGEGRVQSNPTIGLTKRLPAPPKTQHHPAILSLRKFGKLLLDIDAYPGGGKSVVRYALRLMPLIFLRTQELRFAEWKDIDMEESQYLVEAEKMKTKEEHIVPLSRQAMKILDEVRLRTGRGRYVFPNQKLADEPINKGSMLYALRKIISKEEMTVHGFRASARTMLREQLKYPIDWIELQLAHAVPEVHGRAYNRATNLDDRRVMMQGWADYLDKLKEEAAARIEDGIGS